MKGKTVKRTIIVLCAFALSGCAGVASGIAAVAGLPSSPVAVCDKTTLDEQAGIGVELAYKTWRTVGETLTDWGYIKGTKATKVAALDNKLYNLTLAEQNAYKACNSTDYFAAITQIKAAIKNGYALYGSK